jgi:hypothetical protein
MFSRASATVVGQRIVRAGYGMQLGPFRGFPVKPVDVAVQFPLVDPPNAASAELYGGELAGPHEGIDLRGAHAEIGGDVFESEETGLNACGSLASITATSGPFFHNTNDSIDKGRLPVSLFVCLRLPSATAVRLRDEHT